MRSQKPFQQPHHSKLDDEQHKLSPPHPVTDAYSANCSTAVSCKVGATLGSSFGITTYQR